MDILNISNIKKLLIDKETLARIDFLASANKIDDLKPIDMKVVENLIGDIKIQDTCILGKDIIHDVELVESYDKNGTCVLDSIQQLYLKGSKHYLKTILENPIQSFKKLKSRQEIITYYKETLADSTQKTHVEKCFDNMKKTEQDVLWLFEDDHTELNSLYELVYFSSFLTRPANSFPVALSAYNIYRIVVSPLVGILTPITYILIPYIILRIKMKVNVSLMTYVRLMLKGLFSSEISIFKSSKLDKLKYVSFAFSILFYFQSMFNSVEISRSSYSIIKTITNRMKSVVIFIKNGRDLVKTFWHSRISPAFLQDNMHLTDEDIYFDKINIDDSKPFNFMFTNFGYYLNIYKFMDKSSYIPLIKMVYVIDALMSGAKLLLNNSCAFADFKFKPNCSCLNLVDFYHPCLDKELSVTNDIDITNNVIITGPNAGGKSTTIKSIIIAVLLSQTLTLGFYGSCKIAPFYYINSQINIPDCKGQESLFEAEMHRSRSNFTVLANIPEDRSSLIVMDELFNSTNPIEGIAGAYAILDKLTSYPYNISIVTTHYLYLTKLSKSNKFVNYKMNVNISYMPEDPSKVDDIQYPYILQKGISKQYIALELLKRNGFDEDIIENAMRIKQDILFVKQHKKQVVFKTQDISCDSNI